MPLVFYYLSGRFNTVVTYSYISFLVVLENLYLSLIWEPFYCHFTWNPFFGNLCGPQAQPSVKQIPSGVSSLVKRLKLLRNSLQIQHPATGVCERPGLQSQQSWRGILELESNRKWQDAFEQPHTTFCLAKGLAMTKGQRENVNFYCFTRTYLQGAAEPERSFSNAIED